MEASCPCCGTRMEVSAETARLVTLRCPGCGVSEVRTNAPQDTGA